MQRVWQEALSRVDARSGALTGVDVGVDVHLSHPGLVKRAEIGFDGLYPGPSRREQVR
jgi:hypothetical protein